MKVLDFIDYYHDPNLSADQKLYAKTHNGSYMTKKGRYIMSNRDKMSRYLRMFRERILRVFYPITEFKNVDNRHKSDVIKNFPTKNNIWIATKLDYAIVLDLKKKQISYHEYGE